MLLEDLGGVMIWALSYYKKENGQELIHAISENYLNTILDKSIYVPKKILSSVYPNPFNPICKVDTYLFTQVLKNK